MTKRRRPAVLLSPEALEALGSRIVRAISGARKKKNKKRRRRLPVILTAEEVHALLAELEAAIARARTPSKRHNAVRDRLMTLLALHAGLRVSELCALNVENIDIGAPQICVLRGKGDKDRNIPLADCLLPELKACIADRRHGPLFTGPGGRRLAARTYQARLDAIGRRAGILKRVSPHKFRHRFATDALEVLGATLKDVQELLGHASINTTAIYTHTTTRKLKAVVDAISPGGRPQMKTPMEKL